MSVELEMSVKLVTAALAGSLLGLEREIAGHDPGVRTHALVALGACLFTVAGAYGFDETAGSADADPTRIAAQVATGIGFVGAGAILQHRGSVRGLTTAATLWTSAAVGVATGAGLYLAVAVASGMALIILAALRLVTLPVVARLGRRRCTIHIEYRRGHGTLGPIVRELETQRARIARFHLEDDDESCAETGGARRATVDVQHIDNDGLAAVIRCLDGRNEVESVSIEGPHGHRFEH